MTTILFLCVYALPLGILYAIGLFTTAMGTRFNLNLGPAALLLIPVFLIPPIHLFMSVSRMSREAQGGGTYTGRAFPVVPLDPGPAPASQHGGTAPP